MIRLGKRAAAALLLGYMFCGTLGQAPRLVSTFAPPAFASPAGEACRKEICDGVVAGCMHADLSKVWFVRTEADKKAYCSDFFLGCMTRTINPNTAWYSPDTVARLLKCPS